MQNAVIEAVVFDMDGLMIDTEPLYKRAMQKAAEELGFQIEENFFIRLIGLPDTACKAVISEHFGPDFPMQQFWERWPRIWKKEAMTSGIAQKPGLTELLSRLSEIEMPMAIATSSFRQQADFSLRAAGVNHPFEHIVTGDEVENGKPAPDIYLEAAHRLSADPQKCIALEDSENGIRAASAAGMSAIMIPDLIQPSREISGIACCVLSSLYEARDRIDEMLHKPGQQS